MDFTPQNSVGYYAEHNQRYVVYKLLAEYILAPTLWRSLKDFAKARYIFRLCVFVVCR